MKRILFTIVMTIAFFSSNCHAQGFFSLQGPSYLYGSPIVDFPELTSSIVRQYQDNFSVHYCSDVNGNHYFVLTENDRYEKTIVASFPTFLDVHDFEIFDRIVYFCGTQPMNSISGGFVGFISVDDLFFNNGQYTFGFINYIVTAPRASMTSVDRLDVFETGGVVHLAVVGDQVQGANISPSYRRTVGDLWIDPSSGNWTGRILYQKDNHNKPMDITCTENHVVASAFDDTYDKVILLVFDKTSGFTDFPTYADALAIKSYCQLADRDVRVERLQGDDVALSYCYYNPRTSKSGTALLYLQNVAAYPFFPNYWAIHIDHTLSFGLRSLRSNHARDRVYLLQDMETPIWSNRTSSVIDFDINAYPALNVHVWGTGHASLFSLDVRGCREDLSMGGNANSTLKPLFSFGRLGDAGCMTSVVPYYDDITPDVVIGVAKHENQVNVWWPVRPSSAFYPNPKQCFSNVICK